MTFCAPLAAPIVLTLSVTWVGSVKVTEFTVTLPVTVALIRFAKPVPGSKKPEPDEDVPVMFTLADACPAARVPPDVGWAGGGASNLTTSTP